MPKLRTESIGGGDQSWLGSTHGIGNCRTGTLDVSTFTAGTHYPNGFIPSGTALDCADEKALKPYVDGVDAKLGYLFTDQPVVASTDKLPAPVLRHGLINTTKLPIAFVAAPAQGSAAGFTFVGGAS